MPAVKNQRSKSIVQQPNLLDGDFLPLYHPNKADGSRGLRKSPDDIVIALRDKFTGYNAQTNQYRGMFLECLLMNKLTTMLRTKILAKALLANTEVQSSKNNDLPGFMVDGLDTIIGTFGIPAAKAASWAVKQAYAIKILRSNKRINRMANDDIDVRTHISIFAYLFALIVSPELQKFLPDLARESLEQWYATGNELTTNNVPVPVQRAFDDVVDDVLHVIEKDLAERRTPIHYEDMLISAIMGVPASRFHNNGESRVSPLLKDHISSKYQADRSSPRQTAIVSINPILETLGFRAYNEGISTAGLITRQARQKLRRIEIHSKQFNLWKEIADVMIMQREQIVTLQPNSAPVFMAKFLADGVMEVSNRERFLQSKPSAAELLQAKAEAKEFEATVVQDESYTLVLENIVAQFNTNIAAQQEPTTVVDVQQDSTSQNSPTYSERSEVGSVDSGSTPVSTPSPNIPAVDARIKTSKMVTFALDAEQETATKPTWSLTKLRATPARTVADNTSSVDFAVKPFWEQTLRSTPRRPEDKAAETPKGSYFRTAEQIKEAGRLRDSLQTKLVVADDQALERTALRVRADTDYCIDEDEVALVEVPMPAAKGPFSLKHKLKG